MIGSGVSELRPDQFYLLVLASRRHLVAKNGNKNKMLFYFYFGCRPPRICYWENKMTLEIKSQHIISWSVASYSKLLTPVVVSPRVGLPAFVFCSQLALQVISIIAHTQGNLAWTSEYLQSQPWLMQDMCLGSWSIITTVRNLFRSKIRQQITSERWISPTFVCYNNPFKDTRMIYIL